MKKIKCLNCNQEWFSDDVVCYDEPAHTVEEISEEKWSAQDYAEVWSSDLEFENRHDMVDVPSQLLSILSHEIENPVVVTNIMRAAYKQGIGLG